MELRGLQLRLVIRALIASLLAVAGMLQAAALIRDELQRAAGRGVGPVIAQLERREQQVRRKRNLSFVWYRAAQDEDLFLRDTLRTGPESFARIRFASGAILELEENTTVRLESSVPSESLLISGQAYLSTPSELLVLSRVAGEAVKSKKLLIELLQPKRKATLYTKESETKSLNLSWKSHSDSKSDSEFLVQVSRNRKFAKDSTQKVTTQSQSQAQFTAPSAGEYFWRVLHPQIGESPIGSFTVALAKPLEPESPLPESNLFLTRQKATFRWRFPLQLESPATPAPGSHWIEIASEAQLLGEKTRQVIDAASGSIILPDQKPGQSHWRLVSRYDDVEVQSEIRKVQLLDEKDALIQLIEPRAAAVIDDSAPIDFVWTSGVSNLRATLVIRDRDNGREVAQFETQGSPLKGRLNWKQPLVGRLEWQVTARIDDQTVSESPWRFLRIKSSQSPSPEVEEIHLSDVEQPAKLRSLASRSGGGRTSADNPQPEPSPEASLLPPVITRLSTSVDSSSAQLKWTWDRENPKAFQLEIRQAGATEYVHLSTLSPDLRQWDIPFDALNTAAPSSVEIRLRAQSRDERLSPPSESRTIQLLEPVTQLRGTWSGPTSSTATISWVSPISTPPDGSYLILGAFVPNTPDPPLTWVPIFRVPRDNISKTNAHNLTVTIPNSLPRNRPIRIKVIPILHWSEPSETAESIGLVPPSTQVTTLNNPRDFAGRLRALSPTVYLRLNAFTVTPTESTVPAEIPESMTFPARWLQLGSSPRPLPNDTNSRSLKFSTSSQTPPPGTIIEGGHADLDFVPNSADGGIYTLLSWVRAEASLLRFRTLYTPGLTPNDVPGSLPPGWVGLSYGKLAIATNTIPITDLVRTCPPNLVVAADPLPLDEWKWVAVAVNGGAPQLMIDGVSVPLIPCPINETTEPGNWTSPGRIGWGSRDASVQDDRVRSPWTGELSDFALFIGRILPQQVIQSLFQSRNEPFP